MAQIQRAPTFGGRGGDQLGGDLPPFTALSDNPQAPGPILQRHWFRAESARRPILSVTPKRQDNRSTGGARHIISPKLDDTCGIEFSPQAIMDAERWAEALVAAVRSWQQQRGRRHG